MTGRSYSQQCDALLESDSQGRPQVLDGLEGILLRHQYQLVLESIADSIEYESEQLAHHLAESTLIEHSINWFILTSNTS